LRAGPDLRTLDAGPPTQDQIDRRHCVTTAELPAVNAALNAITTVFLLLGYLKVRRRRITAHRRLMTAALLTSAAFLCCYLVYHASVGSVQYPHHDWTRPVYFAILIPHIILATVNVPLIVGLVWFAVRGRFDRHRRLARWTWPSWMIVSASGVAVYVMLYHL